MSVPVGDICIDDGLSLSDEVPWALAAAATAVDDGGCDELVLDELRWLCGDGPVDLVMVSSPLVNLRGF